MRFSPVVISWLTRFYRKNRCLQIMRNTVAINSYLGLSVLSKKSFGLYINLIREGTLCQNILNVIRIFARISKFRCFRQTKQTQNEVGRFFYNLAEFVFEYFRDSMQWENFSKFCKVLSQFVFCNMIVPLPKSLFWLDKALQTPGPPFAVFLARMRSTNPRTKTTCQELIPEAF